jgi:hypothetical protein
LGGPIATASKIAAAAPGGRAVSDCPPGRPCRPAGTPVEPDHKRQCRARKAASSGYPERLTYLPKDVVRIGQPLRVWTGQGWEPGWVVEQTHWEDPIEQAGRAEQGPNRTDLGQE